MSPIHQRLNWHGAVHQADAGVGDVAVEGRCRSGRHVTTITGGAGFSRRGCGGRYQSDIKINHTNKIAIISLFFCTFAIRK